MTYIFPAALRRTLSGFAKDKTVVLLVVFASALVLRLYHVNRFDLWFDELSTNSYTAQDIARTTDTSEVAPAATLLTRLKSDPHSFLYYIFVHLYSHLGAEGKSLRIISVVFSLLALIVFYLFARSLYDERTSAYALLMMLFSPFQMWYAQEARAYAMTGFLAISTVFVFWQALKKDKGMYWAGFAVLGALTVFCSYNSVLLLLATGSAFYFEEYRPHLRKWIIAMVFVAAMLAVFYSIVLFQLDFVRSGFWIPDPPSKQIIYTFLFYVLGYSSTSVQLWVALPVICITAGIGVYSGLRSDKTKTSILIALFLGPILTTFLISKIITPIYLYRQLFIFAPFFYLIVARGLTGIPNLKVQMAAVLLFALMIAMSLANYYRGYVTYDGTRPDIITGVLSKKNYGDILSHVAVHHKEGDMVYAADVQSYVLTRPYIAKNFPRYYRNSFDTFALLKQPVHLQKFEIKYLMAEKAIHSIDGNDMWEYHSFAQLPDGSIAARKFDLAHKRPPRVWLVSSHWWTTAPQEILLEPAKKLLAEYYTHLYSVEQDGVRADLFMRNRDSNTQAETPHE